MFKRLLNCEDNEFDNPGKLLQPLKLANHENPFCLNI